MYLITTCNYILVLRKLHKHRAVWYHIGLHLPGVQRSDLDAIRVDSEDSPNQESNCEACSKKLTELWLKQIDPPPSKEALERAIKKAYEWSRSTRLLITSTVVVLLSIALGSYYYLTTMPLLFESLPTNVVMFGREEDLKNLTKLWLDEKAQFINVYGPPGWGKSTLVMRFGHQVIEGGTSVVYVNMNDTDKFSLLQRNLHDKIPQCSHTRDLPNCIGNQFSATRLLLIILDNTDFAWFEKENNAKLETFMESLQKYSTTVKVIITSRRDLNLKPLDGFKTYTPLKVSNKTCHEIFLHKHEDSRLAQKVCERLGNMPLPVKLVASRFADSTDLCEEDECIAEWVKFEDAVQFSYKHLNRSTQVCASLLVRFPGSFTLVAVRKILPHHMGDTQATKCLTSLLKYSFIDRRQYKLSGDIFLVDLKDRLQFHMLIKETIMKFLDDDSYYSSSDYNVLLIKFGSNFFTYYEPCMIKFWESMDTVWNMSYGKTQPQQELTHEVELQQRAAAEEQVLSGRLVGMACFAEYVNINSLFAFLPPNKSETFQIAVNYSLYRWYSPQTLLTIFPFLSNVFIGHQSILSTLEGGCQNLNFGHNNPGETVTAFANLFNSALQDTDLPTPVCPSCEKVNVLVQRMTRCVEKIEQLAHIGGSSTINGTAIFYGTLYHLCICQSKSCHMHLTRGCARVWEYWLKANFAPLYINFCNLCTESSIEGTDGYLNFVPRLCRSCNSTMSSGIRSFMARDYIKTVKFIKLAIEEEQVTSCNDLKRVIGAMILYSVGYCDNVPEAQGQCLQNILPDQVHCLPQIYSHFEPFFAELNVTNVQLVISNNSKIPATSIIACLHEIIDVFGKHYATPRATFGWAFPNSTAEYDYFHNLWSNFSTVTSFMDYSNGRLVHRTVPIQINTLCLLQYDWDSLLCSLMKVAYL